MSRILDALKKATPHVPSPPEPSSGRDKPLIFEKVNLNPPSAETAQREMEARKEAARRRYVLNEQAVRPMSLSDSRRFLWVLSIVAVLGVLAVIFWPKSSVSPKNLAQENRRLQRLVADLEAQSSQKDAEIEELQKKSADNPSIQRLRDELDSARAEIKRMSRRLTIMLQDNLDKDEQISRLSNR